MIAKVLVALDNSWRAPGVLAAASGRRREAFHREGRRGSLPSPTAPAQRPEALENVGGQGRSTPSAKHPRRSARGARRDGAERGSSASSLRRRGSTRRSRC